MKILVRDRIRNRYLKGGGEWTNNRAEARIFGNGSDAIQATIGYGLTHVEIVHVFPNEKYNFCVAFA